MGLEAIPLHMKTLKCLCDLNLLVLSMAAASRHAQHRAPTTCAYQRAQVGRPCDSGPEECGASHASRHRHFRCRTLAASWP